MNNVYIIGRKERTMNLIKRFFTWLKGLFTKSVKTDSIRDYLPYRAPTEREGKSDGWKKKDAKRKKNARKTSYRSKRVNNGGKKRTQ